MKNKKQIRRIVLWGLLLLSFQKSLAQIPPVIDSSSSIRSSSLTTKYLTPKRIVWISDRSGRSIKNEDYILRPGLGQSDLSQDDFLMISNDSASQNGIVLDFGREIQGGIEIVVPRGNRNPAGTVRIRFGESVSETMSEVGTDGATNDHAMRDFMVTLPWVGRIEIGESGFRFVRIDLVDPNATIKIKEISAVFRYRDIPYLGSFTCNDERLNDIWMTGAYTVHLNMQEYLWDGIKRDRLVWVGDMHPEIMTINAVFGFNEVVPKSLDFAKNSTPLPNYMNGIGSYSIWWVLIQRDWYYYQGDIKYLKEQQGYLSALLRQLSEKIGDDGSETLDGERFLDWPSSENKTAIHAGLHALMVMGFEAGAELSEILGDQETVVLCNESIRKLKSHIPKIGDSKQAAALLAMADLISPEKANAKILARNGAHGMSTFYGYYMLIAQAQAGDFQGAIDNIREYWGAMLDLGATTFWEGFNMDWMKNAAPIDELVPEGKIDVHRTYGEYCYKQLRHSLCHGWASGPTAWLSQYVLGINVLEPGCKKIEISPHLGDLEWVKGTFPTPYGVVTIDHHKRDDGSIKTILTKPEQVEIVIN